MIGVKWWVRELAKKNDRTNEVKEGFLCCCLSLRGAVRGAVVGSVGVSSHVGLTPWAGERTCRLA
jgi:hypothetical protein